jgi:hypothetical protein
MSMQSERFVKIKASATALRQRITSPETRAAAAAAGAAVMAGIVQGIGLLTYTAVSGILAAKDGVVEALYDNTQQNTTTQK